MEKDLISVIVPIYNAEKYLPMCLECIENQTYRNLEIILVDDGSTDGSSGLCDEFAAKDARVSVIHQANKGLWAARNAGQDAANGAFLFFPDADDYFHYDILRQMHGAITSKDGFDVAIVDRTRTESRIESCDAPIECNWTEQSSEVLFKAIFEHLRYPYKTIWNKLFRAQSIKTIHSRPFPVAQDMDFNIQVFIHCKRFICSDSSLYYYYSHDAQISNKQKDKYRTILPEIYFKNYLELKSKKDIFGRVLLEKLYRHMAIQKVYSNETNEKRSFFARCREYYRCTHRDFVRHRDISYMHKVKYLTAYHLPFLVYSLLFIINRTLKLGTFLHLKERMGGIKSQAYIVILSVLARRSLDHQLRRAKRMMDNPTVRVISFDIIDTLLVRLSYYPKDVFHLALRQWKGTTNADLFSKRCLAGRELKQAGVPEPTLEEIWRHIGAKCCLSGEQTKELLQLEIETEKRMTAARGVISELYNHAVRSGKRIIAVSDLYLGSDVLQEMLSLAGYRLPDRIYVSCECNASKGEGTLFDYVLKQESVKNPSQILHVGDNLICDGWMARRKGLRSLCIPSQYHRFLYSARNAGRFLESQMTSVQERCLFGYVLNACEEDGGLSFKKNGLNLRLFSKAILFPLLYRTDEFLLQSEVIQRNYREIYFVSRDGRLPMEGYQMMRDYLGRGLAPVYLYGSRKFYGQHDDAAKEQRVRDYYQQTIHLKERRALVYDIGFHGSISTISDFFDTTCKIDKMYIMQAPKNKEIDRQQETKTFVLYKESFDQMFVFLEPVYNYPTEGSVVDVAPSKDGRFVPVCAPATVDERQKLAVEEIHRIALSLLRSYLPYKVNDFVPDLVGELSRLDWIHHYLDGSPLSSVSCLKDIIFEDPLKTGFKPTPVDRWLRKQYLNKNKAIYYAKVFIYRLLFSRRSQK